VVGGTAAVSDSVFSVLGTYSGNYKDYYNKVYIPVRIAGADRYDTSAKVADWEINYAFDNRDKLWGLAGFSMDEVFVATGENFPDALAGGQLAGGKWYASAKDNNNTISTTIWQRVVGNTKETGYAWDWDAIADRMTSSPILLTKDGDRSADSVIAKYLGWNSDKLSVDAYDFIEGLTNFFKMLDNYIYSDGRYIYDYSLIEEGGLGFFLTGSIDGGETTEEIEDEGLAVFTDGYRTVTNNFVGYILGGKAAVSKAKAEQLDDTVDDCIRKYYDNYAANDGEWISVNFGGKQYYKSLGYVLNSYRGNVGNVYGVLTGFDLVLPIHKNHGPFDHYYAFVGLDDDLNYVFAEFTRNTDIIYTDTYTDQYTGYEFSGMVSCDMTCTDWTRLY
jgi:hypothetical protein